MRATMHIVIIAWLYITLTMALTFTRGIAGAAFFVFAGLAPVALYGWLAIRRRRARRNRDPQRAADPP